MESNPKEHYTALRQLLDHAYAPYSGFHVAARLVTADGIITEGCNVENASFGLGLCAERVAVFRAMSRGLRNFTHLYLASSGNSPVSPCGACREVLRQVTNDLDITMFGSHPNEVECVRLSELLPDPAAVKDSGAANDDNSFKEGARAVHHVDPRLVIEQKRDGNELTPETIGLFMADFLSDKITDYQMTAFLMAVFLKGMTSTETEALSRSMMESGHVLDWKGFAGPFVDKHSTGGIGDKISLVLAPVLAALGLKVPMISGRGLGHTGGTLDKLQAIPGYRVALSEEEMGRQLERVGLFIAGQTPSLVPADRRLYALRDVTATVASPPLIVSSILSKKAAAGLQYLVLDVKYGEGAFMTTLPKARDLAERLVKTAQKLGLKSIAVLSRMEGVLGRTVGNAIEVEESIRMLMGEEMPFDLSELVEVLGGVLLVQTGRVDDMSDARNRIRDVLKSGAALQVFEKWIRAQGCTLDSKTLLQKLPQSPETMTVLADSDGYVSAIKGREMGLFLGRVGGGRLRADDTIFPGVGVRILKSIGEPVKRGDPIFEVYYETEKKPVPEELARLVTLSSDPSERAHLIAGYVTPEGFSKTFHSKI
ncbi:MAG: thymidine phosphorylase [Candidatus Eisenbacteria bacterium]|uniref:Thymidine phosphorylase n=1 Tax=Eiseniibacteriota bacterium TaxID=2212470 RepID=A0A948RZJ9_UNCEI|nr:thymidine phosphorylase [Candidatus Eisenbacteria bacterium]MBU1950471.1 thymidine phosphorylase [Candidatus Eisenbacteria bacterium]MBU2692522.1 thymidine phosphorylase [Candidatus Eisenbacteria bacterium]